MKRFLVVASLLALTLSPLLHLAEAEARDRSPQRDRQRGQAATSAPENPYPNSTRQEPSRAGSSERNTRRIQAAYDAIGDGDYEKARRELATLDGNSRTSAYEQALVDQAKAQIAYEEDDIDQAITLWMKVVDANALPNRDHFQLLFQVAQLQLSEEKYEEALVTLDRWLAETRAERTDILALRGNALYRLERYDEAVSWLDRAIAAAGDQPDPALYELKMATLYEKEDFAAAAATLEALIRLRPNEVKHKINLAQMYIELEQNDRALEILQGAKTGGQLTTPENWRQLYQLLAYADRPREAAAAIQEGLDAGVLRPDRTTLRALGDNLYLAEDIDRAIEAYGRAAADSPDDGNADQMRGHLLVEKERYAEAKQALQAALAKGQLTDEGTAHLLLGEAEHELGNLAAARAAFQQATRFERSKSNAELWLRNLR
jgi:tetratricopeptide (TPR) repeat protein